MNILFYKDQFQEEKHWVEKYEDIFPLTRTFALFKIITIEGNWGDVYPVQFSYSVGILLYSRLDCIYCIKDIFIQIKICN